MSREYADKRIREALALSKGNPTKARRQVMAWLNEDPKLLMALTQPHLTGIIAHAINRVVYRADQGLDEPEEIPETPAGLNMSSESFGQEILRALQGSTAVFGHENSAPTGRRGQASQRHIDAMKRIAKKDESGKK